MSSNEKSPNKIQWFFFVIFIPIVFTIILVSVVLSFFGFNVIDKAKEVSGKLPFVSEMLSEEPTKDEIILTLEQQIDELESQISEQQSEINQQEAEIETLITKSDQQKQNQTNEQETVSVTNKDLQEAAKTYEAMSPKNAAAILSNLPNEEALKHLTYISIDSRARILAKMDSEKAAELMSKLANE